MKRMKVSKFSAFFISNTCHLYFDIQIINIIHCDGHSISAGLFNTHLLQTNITLGGPKD